MDKTLDFSKNIYELCTANPDIIEIMQELGFENITGKGMLNTVGRIMTIPKGAAMKNIPIEHIKATFEDKGYTIL
ncbi:MAG: hypothetical protein CVU84_11810 [Firmicutes bacterium HGW-Firmicutes-1]|jgi:hypothetical protein|nr:MAG: hypothetical protein CVU84_11810 [Firmicutes bacterium HGW-Firmicutes-1]